MEIKTKYGVATDDCRAACPTCLHRLDWPRHSKDIRGRVVECCIDAAHSGHIYDSECLRFYNRKDAKAHRAAVKARLRNCGIAPMRDGFVSTYGRDTFVSIS